MGFILRLLTATALIVGAGSAVGSRIVADSQRPASSPIALARPTPIPTAVSAPTRSPHPAAIPRSRTAESHPTPTAKSDPAPTAEPDPTRAVAAVRAIVPAAAVGVRVVDRRTGIAVGVYSDRPFFSASLVKLLIAIDALQRSADPALADRVRYMLSYSDDATASQLWVDDGGPEIVRRTAAEIGLRHTEPPDPAGMWGATQLTADDVARIYRYLLDRLAAWPRAVVLGALRSARSHGSDGFAQHFGIPDAEPATPHAVKQGWMRYAGLVELHSSGLVGANNRYVVVVLTAYPAGTSWASARTAVTAGVRALKLSG